MLGRGHISQIVKMHYFFLNIFFTIKHIGQTDYISLITKKEFTNIANCMTPGPKVLVLGVAILKMHYIFKIFSSTPDHMFEKLCI